MQSFRCFWLSAKDLILTLLAVSCFSPARPAGLTGWLFHHRDSKQTAIIGLELWKYWLQRWWAFTGSCRREHTASGRLLLYELPSAHSAHTHTYDHTHDHTLLILIFTLPFSFSLPFVPLILFSAVKGYCDSFKALGLESKAVSEERVKGIDRTEQTAACLSRHSIVHCSQNESMTQNALSSNISLIAWH